MNTVKKIFINTPEIIEVPEEFVNKKTEIIFISDDSHYIKNKSIGDYFGCLPDFPEKEDAGCFELREQL